MRLLPKHPKTKTPQHQKKLIMKKTTIITLIVLAGCVNVCSTVLFYQEVGKLLRTQLLNKTLPVNPFSLTIHNPPTFNGLVEKVTHTLDHLMEVTQTPKIVKPCSKRI